MNKLRMIYRFIETKINQIPSYFKTLKFFCAEWIAIYRKRNIYAEVQLTEKQKQEVYALWGSKIPLYWHRLYTKMSGTFDPTYIPEYFYTVKLEPKLNPFEYAKVLSDKNLLYTLFDNLDYVRIPERYVANCNGVFLDANNNCFTQEEAVSYLRKLNVEVAIIKPTIQTSSGENVRVIDLKTCDIYKLFTEYKKNFIIQEKIVQHEDLMKLNPSSLNTLRLTTFRKDWEIRSTPNSLRIGRKNSHLDNIHAGGLGIGISEKGCLNTTAFELAYGNKMNLFLSHPDSGIIFSGYLITLFEKALTTAKKLHARVPQLGIISWDFSIDEEGNIVIIEMNTQGQSVWFPQIINGEGLFGEDSKDMITFLNLKR